MVDLNPYIKEQLAKSSTGQTLLTRLETTRSPATTKTSSYTPQFISDIESGNVIKKVVEGSGYTPPVPVSPVQPSGPTLEGQLNIWGMKPVPPSTIQTSYQDVYASYNTQLETTNSNIVYVEGLPPGTSVTLESGESVSREQALTLLREQQSNLMSNREQVHSYENQGYTVQIDKKTGEYVFYKRQIPTVVEIPVEEVDYKTWWFQREKELGPIVSAAKAIAAGTLNLFNPDYWGAIIGGRGGEYIYKQEYEDWKSINKGKGFDVWINRQVPAYENVILPFTIAAGFGVALGAIGKIGTGAIKVTGTGAKIVASTAGVFSKVAPVVLGGTFATMTGINIGKTFAYEQHGLAPPGAGISSVIGTGMQLGSGYAGYKWATEFKPVIGEYREGETVYLKKYLTSIGNKPILGYGKPVYLTSGGTFGKIIGPMPGNLKSVKWEISEPFISKTSVYGTTPVWKPDLGTVPSSITNIKPMGETLIPVFFKGKTTFITGEGWQPKIDTGLIVKPPSSITEPFKPIKIPEVVKWQPDTGLSVHPGEIKTIDELFKVYQKGKITTEDYQSYRDIIKNNEQKIVEKISPISKPLFKPKPIVSKVEPIRVKSRDGLIVSEWYGKTFVETGEGWQPKISKNKFLSTMVYPKPIIYGSYQTHFFVVVYEPPPVVSVKPKILQFKPFKKSVKDIVPSDKTIAKKFGSEQTQRTGTVTIQETQKITQQIVKPVQVTEKDVVTSPLSKNIVVPEELLKPVYKRQPELKDLLKSKRFQEYEPVRIVEQEKATSMLSALFPVQVQKKESALVVAQKQELGLKSAKATITLPLTITISEQGKIFDFGKDFIKETIKIYDYDFFKSIKPIKPVPPITITPPPPIETKRPPPPPPIDISGELQDKVQSGQTVFHVSLRKRQFVNGKRIADKSYHRVTKKPLSYMDALAFAAHKVDNTAKASFKLEKTTGKPGKLPKSVKPWSSMMLEYDNKGGDRFVELPSFRIDSPGEIREISMRGWNSPRKKRSRRRIR